MNTQGAPSGDSASSPEPRPADVAPEADLPADVAPEADLPADVAPEADLPPKPDAPSGNGEREPQGIYPDEMTLPPSYHPSSSQPAHGHVQPHTAPRFVAPPVRQRHRRDWLILVFALVVSALLMAACCIAGFAFYVRNGGWFG